MSKNDQQFSGFASALFDDLDPMFSNLVIERDNSDHVTAEKTAQGIRAYLAQAAYDFACHVASHVSEWNAAEMEVRFKTPQEVVDEMPDMPELPEETNE